MPVDLFQRRAGLGIRTRFLRPVVDRDVGLVDLEPDRHVSRPGPDRGSEARPVLDHGRVGVVGDHADVQRVVRRLRNATDPRAKPDTPDPTGRRPKPRRQPPHPISLNPLHPPRPKQIRC